MASHDVDNGPPENWNVPTMASHDVDDERTSRGLECPDDGLPRRRRTSCRVRGPDDGLPRRRTDEGLPRRRRWPDDGHVVNRHVDDGLA